MGIEAKWAIQIIGNWATIKLPKYGGQGKVDGKGVDMGNRI